MIVSKYCPSLLACHIPLTTVPDRLCYPALDVVSRWCLSYDGWQLVEVACTVLLLDGLFLWLALWRALITFLVCQPVRETSLVAVVLRPTQPSFPPWLVIDNLGRAKDGTFVDKWVVMQVNCAIPQQRVPYLSVSLMRFWNAQKYVSWRGLVMRLLRDCSVLK